MYYSTRDHGLRATLRQAVLQGLASDGGLYLPEGVKELPAAFFKNISQMSLSEIGYVVANTLMGEDMESETTKTLVAESFSFDVPVTGIGTSGIHAIELFHGPTLAIKDVGARFMAKLMRHYVDASRKVTVLVATMGDTGSAVAAGFHNLPGVNVAILYPSGQVSGIQEAQFATLGDNVTAIAVDGSFDRCQEMIREAFADKELSSRLQLTTANSINVARMLPQTLYFFHGYARMVEAGANPGEIVVSIPCGNLGTLVAATVARRMGLPLKRVIAVNSRGGFFSRYMSTGDTTPRSVAPGVTTSINVANPLNFERLTDLYDNDREWMAREIDAVEVDDDTIISTIADVDREHGYILDPHSAAAFAALQSRLRPGEQGLVVAAAHPAKFIQTVERAIGRPLDLPDEIMKMLSRPRRRYHLSPSYNQLKEFLLKHF